MTHKFNVPDERQKALLTKNQINLDGLVFLNETEQYLTVRRQKTGDEITIHKGDLTQRLEREANIEW